MPGSYATISDGAPWATLHIAADRWRDSRRFLSEILEVQIRFVERGRHHDARWLIPPTGGFAFIAGPAGETIELFDKEIP